MIKSIRTIMKQDKERYKVPRKVQDVIPIRRIWPDGIFQVGSKFTKMYRFTDINYLVASREDIILMLTRKSSWQNCWMRSIGRFGVPYFTVSEQVMVKS